MAQLSGTGKDAVGVEISAMVGSLDGSPLLNRSTKIWYQMTFFDHSGGPLLIVVFVSLSHAAKASNNRRDGIVLFILTIFREAVCHGPQQQ